MQTNNNALEQVPTFLPNMHCFYALYFHKEWLNDPDDWVQAERSHEMNIKTKSF